MKKIKNIDEIFVEKSLLQIASGRYYKLATETKQLWAKKAFKVAAAKEWNSLPKELREIKSLQSFKNKFFHFV